jgi:hypothetical protein
MTALKLLQTEMMRPPDGPLTRPALQTRNALKNWRKTAKVSGCRAATALIARDTFQAQEMPLTGYSVHKLTGSRSLVKGERLNAAIRAAA